MMAPEEQPVVFIVDDDASVRFGVGDLLRSVGLGVETFGSTHEFIQGRRPDVPGCIVLDVRLPGASGLEFQRTLAQSSVRLPERVAFRPRDAQSYRTDPGRVAA